MLNKISLATALFVSGLYAAPTPTPVPTAAPAKPQKVEQKQKKVNTDFDSKKDYNGVRLLLETRSSGNNNSNNNANRNTGSVGMPSISNSQSEPDSELDIPIPLKSVVVGDSIVVYAMYTEKGSNIQQLSMPSMPQSYGNSDQSVSPDGQPSMNGIKIPSNQSIMNPAQDPLVGPLMAQNGINVNGAGSAQSTGTGSQSNDQQHTIILRVGAKFNGWVVETLSSTYVVFYSKQLKKHVKKYY